MKKDDIEQLTRYLSKLFNCSDIELRQRNKITDSAELYKNNEFLGTIYKDQEDGEVSYSLTIAILPDVL